MQARLTGDLIAAAFSMGALYGLVGEVEDVYAAWVEGFEVENVHVEVSARFRSEC